MPIREDEYLPSKEELTVPEINVTSAVMRAASPYMGKYCDNVSKEFMLCRSESRGDARRCINEGKEVTRCGLEFLQKVKKNCYESFTQYWNCIDRAENYEFKHCRETQKLFDDCVGPALNVERPPIGYFSKIRVLDTNQPRPQYNDPVIPPVVPEFNP